MAANVNINELIKKSTCFGVAYESTAKECKVCEAKAMCAKHTESGEPYNPNEVATQPKAAPKATAPKVAPQPNAEASEPATKATAPKAKAAKTKADKPAVNYSDDMPVFKDMSIEELEALATERGLDLADFERFKAENIKRMQLTMKLKKTYAV